jgi:hypothetical protein
MHNIVEKHFGISIAPVRSRGGSLVIYRTMTIKRIISRNVSEPSILRDHAFAWSYINWILRLFNKYRLKMKAIEPRQPTMIDSTFFIELI